MKKIRVNELLQIINKPESSSVLIKVTKENTFENEIIEPFINRPGLALTGYLERFTHQRIQIFGDPEIGYLNNLDRETAYDRLEKIFKYNIPCFIVSKGNSVPKYMEYLGNQANIPILKTALATDSIIKKLSFHLQRIFAPFVIEHSTFIDVYGIGVLLIGKSGVGKSECALDLIERGHRLITDDSTKITLVEEEVLMGSSINDLTFFMEIRGVGIIDIQRMFGIQAVEKRKRISIVIELLPYNPDKNYDAVVYERLDNKRFKKILNTSIPLMQLPVSPGKNMSIVVETAVLNFMLQTYGYNAANRFMENQLERIKK